MSEWKAKRFWKETTHEATEGGWTIRLDGRPVKTPAKIALVVPTEELAREIAAEWNAQEEVIQPLTMPFTRCANAAIDRVANQRDAVVEIIAAYGETDLLCYRAEQPYELIERQAASWDPLLAWSKDELAAELTVHSGVMFGSQPEAALKTLFAHVDEMSPFQLSALHDLVAMSGSLVLGLAVAKGRIDSEAAWDVSRIDEEWQIQQWGRDEEADALAAQKREEFLRAEKLFRMV